MCLDPCEQLAVTCNTALTVALLVLRILHYSASFYFRVLVPMEYNDSSNKLHVFIHENHWDDAHSACTALAAQYNIMIW